ncbi:MAG: Hpt domain-containing protein, partial [Variovorax sp.]
MFFCSQAVPGSRDQAKTLRAVRVAWGLADERPVDYTSEQFGRFDPVVLTQARKRIEAAKEMWSALSGGDLSRLRQVVDTFAQLSESLQKLHPPSLPMAQALTNAVDASLRSGQPPATELAMEVATSVLYLEAAFEDLDPQDRQLTARTVQLAGRIERAREGGRSEPLEPWMEELYRRVSDRQTMGTVVGELRSHLGELEKSLDQFFRRPSEKGLLRTVPTQLMQMRGVFSVLGLDQAAQTVQRMRDHVDQLLADAAPADESRVFDSLGNNLGALGFLIDMLGYQPALAKRLFVFDEASGELKPLMGRQGADTAVPDAAVASASTATPAGADTVLSVAEVDAQIAARLAALAAPPRKKASPIEEFSRAADSWTSKITGPAPLDGLPDTEVTELEEEDLQNIFLDEAREVLHGGLAAVAVLRRDGTDIGALTVLRRAFHTLKGSSRMVGLMDFGEAAWSFEQVLNTWLADQRPATPELLYATDNAMRDFANWVEAIAAGEPHAWQVEPFRRVAEALRNGEPMAVPAPVANAGTLAAAARRIADEPPAPAPSVSEPVAEAQMPQAPQMLDLPDLPDLDFPSTAFEPPSFDAPVPSAQPSARLEEDHGDFDEPFASTDFLDFEEPPVLREAEADPLAGAESIDFLLDAHPASEASATALPPAFGGEMPAPLLKEAAEPEPVAEEPAVAEAPVSVAPEAAAPSPETEPEPEPAVAATEAEAESSAVPGADDQIKVIGPLRIGIALYNVYLNEADEWSRQLATEVGEWALESYLPMPDSTVGLAHSLAGSSATVGFQSMSGMARLLEAALQHLHMQGSGTPEQGAVLVAATDELRRLLHQFAAGFLKEPAPETLEALRDVAAAPMPAEAREPSVADAVVEAAEVAEPVAVAVAAPVEPEHPPKAEVPQLAEVRDVVSMPAFATEPAVYDDSEDEIDLADAVDADLFPIFEEEAAELLPQLGTALREWQEQPGSAAPRASTLRTLHTLKGSARLAGAMRLGERAHRMESEIELLGSSGVERASIEHLLARFDVLQATFDGLRAADDATQAEIAQRALEAAATAKRKAAETPAPAVVALVSTEPANEPIHANAADLAARADKPALPTPTVLAP